MNKNILIINGPNLNFLGRPEMSINGKETLPDLHSIIYQCITNQEWQARLGVQGNIEAIEDLKKMLK